MSIDYAACVQAELAYKSIVNIIESSLKLPLVLLTELRNAIKTLRAIAFGGIELAFENLLKLIDVCDKLPEDLSNIRTDFCEALLKCEFLFKSALPDPDPATGGYLDPSSDDYVSAYEWFKRNICGNGLAAYLTQLKAQFKGQMEEFVNYLLGELGIDYIEKQIKDLTDKYIEYINSPIKSYFSLFPTIFDTAFGWANTSGILDSETANILDLLDFTKIFADCIFAVCDLSQSVNNFINDSRTKLSVGSSSTKSFIPGPGEIRMFSKINDIRDTLTGSLRRSPCYV